MISMNSLEGLVKARLFVMHEDCCPNNEEDATLISIYLTISKKNKKTIPNLSHFREIVCESYVVVLVLVHLYNKLHKNVVCCILIGYNEQIQGQSYYGLTTNQTYVYITVVLDEALAWQSKEVSLLELTTLE